MEGPRYVNDCAECTFLGCWNEFDLYLCANGGQPTVVSRRGRTTNSGLGSGISEELIVGQHVALSRKLVTDAEVAGADFGEDQLEEGVKNFGKFPVSKWDAFTEVPMRQAMVRRLVRHQDPGVRVGIARRTDLLPEEILTLAKDPDPSVRRMVSYKLDLDPDLIWLIAHDPHAGVRSHYIFYQHQFPAELANLLPINVPISHYVDTDNTELAQEVLSFPTWKRNSPFAPGDRSRSFQALENIGREVDWFAAWQEAGGEGWEVTGETKSDTDGPSKVFSGSLQLPLGTDGAFRILERHEGISAVGLIQVAGKRSRWQVNMVDLAKTGRPPLVIPSAGRIPLGGQVELAGHLIFRCQEMTPALVALWSFDGQVVGASLERRSLDTPTRCDVGDVKFLGEMWENSFLRLGDSIRKPMGRGLEL